MPADPSPWQSHRWAALASLAVVTALAGLMWYLGGGCEKEPPPPPPPEGPTRAAADTLEMLRDPAVAELALQVAWFYARQERLPIDLEELAARHPGPGWPDVPRTAARGRAMAYRPRTGRAYEITLAGPGGEADPETVHLLMDVPATLPTELGAEAFRTWWDLEYTRRLARELTDRLKALPPEPAPE